MTQHTQDDTRVENCDLFYTIDLHSFQAQHLLITIINNF